jgi:glycosyltransferase involved in cell wall biosynthesis
MYLVLVPVPIIVDGDRRLVGTEWKRALILLRDSLEGRYGDIVVAAPWISADAPAAREQAAVEIDKDDGIRLEPLFDSRVRARAFWTSELPRLVPRLTELIRESSVLHAGLDELFRPATQLAFLVALRHGTPTVFVQDTDVALQVPELHNFRPRSRMYAWFYEKLCRSSVQYADLSLLKGKALMLRYAQHAKNPRQFQDTSYLSSEIVPEQRIEARLARLASDRPLRFVYCGRLVARKGVSESIRILQLAHQRGARATLDVLGGGPEWDALHEQVSRAGLQRSVRFHGTKPYGSGLLHELAEYDAILFTPVVEDTPRMIFDGYAAGLPLVGSGIPYVLERAEEERATVVLPRDDIEGAVERICAIDARRNELVSLTHAAMRGARENAADIWYSRRAHWTHEVAPRAGRSKARGIHVGLFSSMLAWVQEMGLAGPLLGI